MTDAAANPSPSASRLGGLDALRGIAALAVVIYHYTHHFDTVFHTRRDLLFSFSRGHLGVQLFFVISGFVILMTLERSKSIADFVIARFSRLFPAFWIAAIFSYLIIEWADIPYMRIRPIDALMNATMIPGFLGFHRIDGVYWTLQIELFFYILMAAIFALGLPKHLLRILAVILLVKLTDLRVGLQIPPPARSLLVLDHLQLFAPGIVIYLARRGWRWEYGFILALSYLAVAGDQRAQFDAQSAVKHTLAVMFIGGLVWASTRWSLPLTSHPLVQFLGAISYTLYLIHANLGYVILYQAHQAGWNANAAAALALTAAIGGAAAITWGVEKPAMRAIRGRFRGRPT